MKINYTTDRNIQMLIGLLKQNGISRVVASPGTTNMAFVASIQNDKFFKIYSCVDERSACYMACGLAVECNAPVVLTCTGATASRNYMPGLTEAYYRKIPILAITAAQHFSKIESNSPQFIDRTQSLKDTVKMSVQVPTISSEADALGCNILLNKAILELKHKGFGPVHINITTTPSGNTNFDVTELPLARCINRFELKDELPQIKKKNICIFVGSHKRWEEKLVTAVDKFCEKYNAIVLCDHTSNYHGKYKILGNIVCDQDRYNFPLNNFDLLIHLGEVSGAYMSINTSEVWRVDPDGKIKDTFGKLKYVFEMEEINFFEKYTSDCSEENKNTTNYNLWNKELLELNEKIQDDDLPLSNIYVSKKIIENIPDNSTVHLAILNSLRSWNYINTTKQLNVYCNTGGFGIDGPMSTLIGASLVNQDKNYYGVVGDLAFFYDLNSLGNKNIKNNLRIILINNGCGTEFHNYTHPAYMLGEMAKDYIAADGHFGNKSKELVKHYAEDLGFKYISASTKNEFLDNINYFTSEEIFDKPVIFEIFTNSNDESDALKKIRNLKISIKTATTQKIKKILSPELKKAIKKIIKK